jgi:dTMP kinase
LPIKAYVPTSLFAGLSVEQVWCAPGGGMSKLTTAGGLEREKIDFHKKVRSGFLDLAWSEPGRFRIIDASHSETHVAAEIRKIIDRELG